MSLVSLSLEPAQEFKSLVARIEKATGHDLMKRQVDAVCDVVRDRLEVEPDAGQDDLTALATKAAKAIAAGVAALSADPVTPSGV